MATSTFLMSAATLATALKMRPAVNDGRHERIEGSPSEHDVEVLSGKWDDFDELYLAIQNYWSAETDRSWQEAIARTFIRNLEPDVSDESEQTIVASWQLSLKLGTPDRRGLVSEHAVVRLINYRRIFERTVRQLSRVAFFDLGEMKLAFAVTIPNVRNASEILKTNVEDVGRMLISQKLAGSTWTRVTSQFGVLQQNIFTLRD